MVILIYIHTQTATEFQATMEIGAKGGKKEERKN